MTPRQKEIYELSLSGMSGRAIARHLGLDHSTVREHLKRARQYANAPDGVKTALQQTGLQDIGTLHSGWLKTDEASLYFIQPKESPAQALQAAVDRIVEVVKEITPLEPIAAPPHLSDDLLTIYPIADAHIGMRAIREESGDDYSIDIAAKRIGAAFDELMQSSGPARHAVILDVGDLTHADDTNYQTPKSKHQLDMDGTQYESIDAAIAVLSNAIFSAMRKHEFVTVRILRGNHNENSYLAVMFALYERFRDNDRVTIEKTPADFFVHQFGKNMFAAHHGDKSRAERLVMHMAHEWPEMWGQTKWRFYFTGHLHHAKLQDIGGVQVEQLRAATSRDKYAATHGYVGAPQMQAITYHKELGEKSRVKVNF
jgi:hypothetical protein